MRSLLRHLIKRRHGIRDSGVAVAVALMTGFMLLVATSGLVAKQMMSRRASASESYKQLAELAAGNGMNRILAALNDDAANISHLWKLSQNEEYTPVGQPLQQWDLSGNALRMSMTQPCAQTNGLGPERDVLFSGDLSNGKNLRDDGRKDSVQISYRLRSYNYSAGDSKATFAVEGYATAGQGDSAKVLGRSLLTRVLALKDLHNNDNDWGVIAGRSMQLGPSRIDGDGRILWMLNQSQAENVVRQTACNTGQLANQLGISSSNTAARLWPLSSTTDADLEFPSAGIFDQKTSIDRVNTSSSSDRRIWSIDDSRTTMCNGTRPSRGASGDAICVRGESQGRWSALESASTVRRFRGRVRQITLHSDDICRGDSSKPCTIWIEKINLSRGAQLSIETGSQNGARPVVLRMLRPQESITLTNGTLCQARYSRSSARPLPCQNPTQSTATNLVILGTGGSKSNSCSNPGQHLSFGGNALPSAFVLLPQGTVSVQRAAAMNGAIWAHNICASAGVALTTRQPGGSLIESFKETWQPDDSLTFGRTITKGVRGTGLDMFVRW